MAIEKAHRGASCLSLRQKRGKFSYEHHCSLLNFSLWFNGKEFKIVDGTKVCSLQCRREDIRKSFNGRAYAAAGGVPSRFAWSVPSPRKRKAPLERHPLPPKKELFATTSTSSQAELVSKTDTMAESPSESTSTASNSKSNRNTEPNDTDLEFKAQKKIEEMEQELLKH